MPICYYEYWSSVLRMYLPEILEDQFPFCMIFQSADCLVNPALVIKPALMEWLVLSDGDNASWKARVLIFLFTKVLLMVWLLWSMNKGAALANCLATFLFLRAVKIEWTWWAFWHTAYLVRLVWFDLTKCEWFPISSWHLT